MSIQVSVDGVIYNIPTEGERGWGENVTNWIEAVSDKLNEISSDVDIPLTSFTLTNNQSSFADITGMILDTSTVRGCNITYSVYRVVTSGLTVISELSETGNIQVTYKSSALTWELTQTKTGSSGIQFGITTDGQIQYKSTNATGGVHAGNIKFVGKSIPSN